jgi:hypothetical protein
MRPKRRRQWHSTPVWAIATAALAFLEMIRLLASASFSNGNSSISEGALLAHTTRIGADLRTGEDGEAGLMRCGWRLQASQMLTFIAMALLFFGVVTPLAIILRVAGRDRLQLRHQPQKASYWMIRQSSGERPNTVTRAV